MEIRVETTWFIGEGAYEVKEGSNVQINLDNGEVVVGDVLSIHEESISINSSLLGEIDAIHIDNIESMDIID